MEMMIAEYEAHQQARERTSSRVSASAPTGRNRRVVADTPPVALAQGKSLGVDPKTGHEIVERVREDGIVVRHRKIEEGEAILWAIAGKKPKSFENK